MIPFATTHLEPLTEEEADSLYELMQQARQQPHSAIALDGEGRVIGLVGVDDPREEHQVHDFDVHA